MKKIDLMGGRLGLVYFNFIMKKLKVNIPYALPGFVWLDSKRMTPPPPL